MVADLKPKVKASKPIKRQIASFSRWMHLYVSTVSFTIVLFFAATGLTLNHADWFEKNPKLTKSEGKIEQRWIKSLDTSQIKKFEIIDYLQSNRHLGGHLQDFRIEETSISVSFVGPGYSADVRIDRNTGAFTALETKFGFISKLNDLHKGRDTSKSWHLIIDIAAIFMSLISLSGFLMVFFMGKKRLGALLFILLGTAAIYGIYLLS